LPVVPGACNDACDVLSHTCLDHMSTNSSPRLHNFQFHHLDLDRKTFNPGYLSSAMIDHILGRPSQKLKSLQVLLVLIAWTSYLIKGNRHGPYFVRRISRRTAGHLTAWQVFCMTLSGLYLIKNADKLLGLGGMSVLFGNRSS
jgi:hypothetical protein